MSESNSPQEPDYEVAVVGAGVAGLAAASLLGRCGRRAVVIGPSERENSVAAEVHNLPYAEGVTPADLYAEMERDVARHGIVRVIESVKAASVDDERRQVVLTTPTGSIAASRLVLANGIRHEVPAWVPDGAWGTSVFACPFCHAYEHRGQDFLVVGPPIPKILEFSLLCTPHARSLTVLVPRDEALAGALTDRIVAMNGQVRCDTVGAAELLNSGALAITTAGGDRLVVGAVALFNTIRMRTELAADLGLRTDEFGIPEVDEDGRSSHPRVWVAGNAAAPHYVLVEAMGSGLRAGMSVHGDLALDSTLW